MTILLSFILLNILHDAVVDAEIIPVEDFDQGLEQSWVGRYENFQDIYSIESEGDEVFLSAVANGSDNLIIKKVDIDIAEYPFLNWSWRAHTLPEGGDESVKKSCDAAASVAVVLNKSRILPKSMKYTWSTSLARDSLTKSPYAFWPSRCDIRVIESGGDHLGQWRKVKVNLLEDYKYFYRKEDVKKKHVRAIVIMTDSDNTGSTSAADYDQFFFSKQ